MAFIECQYPEGCPIEHLRKDWQALVDKKNQLLLATHEMDGTLLPQINANIAAAESLKPEITETEHRINSIHPCAVCPTPER